MGNSQNFALITGATSGIGYELAKVFAVSGHNLVIVARHRKDLERVARQLETAYGIHVHAIAKNLFNPNSAFELYQELKSRGIKINILANNAGHGLYGEFSKADLRKELSIIQLNISSLVILTKLFLKDMVKKGEGKILNTSSLASKSPGPWQSVYHGSKAFVQSFTEAIREEVQDTGITITALLPGATDTDFFRKAGMKESKIVQDKSKLSDPADVAKAGYDGLMAGEDTVVAGFNEKLEAGTPA